MFAYSVYRYTQITLVYRASKIKKNVIPLFYSTNKAIHVLAIYRDMSLCTSNTLANPIDNPIYISSITWSPGVAHIKTQTLRSLYPYYDLYYSLLYYAYSV